MRTIGIRASPSVVTFAVFDDANGEIINVEEIVIPLAFSTPAALKYVRNNLLDVLREFEVEKAGIRATESNSQTLNIARIQLEGVIQEAFASSNLAAYYIGQISSISARIGIERADFKPYVDGTKSWEVENWTQLSKEQREAVLCAIGAVNA
ncbi:hypothetical protein G8765_01435 [Janthinobacterium lividum]|nr:hypothetical protein G8765_01435 [Janthinobacterium lividum]